MGIISLGARFVGFLNWPHSVTGPWSTTRLTTQVNNSQQPHFVATDFGDKQTLLN